MHRFRPLRHGHALVLCTALLFLLTAFAAGADDWTRFRGPTQTGTAAQGAAADWPDEPALEVVWKTAIGPGYSSVVAHGDTVYTGFAADGEDWLGAFDRATGALRWKVSLGDYYAGHDGSDDGPIATPVVAEIGTGDDARGMVYALGGHGRLVAASTDGEVVWSVELSSMGKAPFYGFSASPVVVQGAAQENVHGKDSAVLVTEVAAGEGPTVAGFDPLTGEVKWQVGDDTVMYQSPVVLDLGGRRQVVASGIKTLYAIDPFSGELLWSHEYGGEPRAMGSASNVPLYLGDDTFLVKPDAQSVSALKVQQGEDGWVVEHVWTSKDLARSYVPAVRRDDRIFGYKGGFLHALDAETGDTAWRSRPPGDGFLAVADDYLVVATKKGSLHLAHATADGWHELASIDLFDDPDQDNAIWSDPIVAGGDIFVRSMSGLARVAVRAAGDDLGQQTADAGRGLEPPAGAFADFVASLDEARDKAAAVDAFLAAQDSLPLIEAGHVVFLFRTDEDSAGIESALLGDRTQGEMRPVEGTDLYYFVDALPADAWAHYRFVPGLGDPVTDPLNPERQSVVMGPEGPEPFSFVTGPDWRPAAYLAAEPVAEDRVVHHDVPLPPGVHPGGAAASGSEETEGQEPAEGEAGDAVMAEPKIATRGIDVYLPPDFDEDRANPYPVVFLPFGDQVRGPLDLDRAMNHFLGESLPDAVVVLVGPHDPRPGFDLFAGAEAAVESFHEQIVPYVLANYPVAESGPHHAYVGFAMSASHAMDMAFDARSRAGRLALVQPFFLDSQSQAYLAAAADFEARPHIYFETSPLSLRAEHEGFDSQVSIRRLASDLEEMGYEVTMGESHVAFALPGMKTRVDEALAFALTGTAEVPSEQ